MRIYLMTVLAVCALCGAAVFLFQNRKSEKHVRYLASLVMLIALIAPLPGLLSSEIDLTRFTDTQSHFHAETYTDAMIRETEKRLNEEFAVLIEKKCELSRDDFTVKTELSAKDHEIGIQEIVIDLCSLKAIVRREEIRKILGTYCENTVFHETPYEVKKNEQYEKSGNE